MVAVHDLAIHPTEHDLIIATHGRGIYIIDDLTALRGLTAEILESNVAVLPSRPSPMVLCRRSRTGSAPTTSSSAATPSEAATIDYWLKKRHLFGDLKIEVYDARRRAHHDAAGQKAARPQPGRLADASANRQRSRRRPRWYPPSSDRGCPRAPTPSSSSRARRPSRVRSSWSPTRATRTPRRIDCCSRRRRSRSTTCSGISPSSPTAWSTCATRRRIERRR